MKKDFRGNSTTAWIALLICVMLLISGCDSKKENRPQDEVAKLVNRNYTVILEDIKENDFSDTKALEGVEEVYSDGDALQVDCGGSGFGSETNYWGFYYSPEDRPLFVWCGDEWLDPLQEDGNGFSYHESNGDNSYYTEKIRDNFYYYEAHF